MCAPKWSYKDYIIRALSFQVSEAPVPGQACHDVELASFAHPLRNLPCLEWLSLQSGTFHRLAIPSCMTSLLIGDICVVCAHEVFSLTCLKTLVILKLGLKGLEGLKLA